MVIVVLLNNGGSILAVGFVVVLFLMDACSSIGRAADSKSAGWGFDSLRACQFLISYRCLAPATGSCPNFYQHNLD
jgi:hypothetical protein